MAMELGFKELSTNAKIIAIAVIFIFFISLVSAELTSADSIKAYDSKTQTVTLINKTDLTKNIATLKLNTPIINYVGYGKVEKVAEIEIRSYTDFNNALKDIKFYNLNDNMKEVNRNFQYKYKTYEDFLVDDYKETCKADLKNGSICSYEVIGQHIEQREVWLPLGKTDLLKDEILTIGIFTYVYKEDRIEWIPEYYNVKINEWAIWEASLNNGLMSYFKLDEGTIIYDSVKGVAFNGTLGAGTTNTTGKILSGYQSGGGGFIGNITNSARTFTTGYTDISTSMWVYTNQTDGDVRYLLTLGSKTTAGKVFAINRRNTGLLGWTSYNATYDKISTYNMSSNLNNWTHIVIIAETNTSHTLIQFWINGVNHQNITSFRITGYESQFGYIGANNDGTQNIIGKIDEVGIWNRTLSQSEILDLYNGFEGISYEAISISPPSLTLNSPVNYYNSSISSIQFNFTALDYNVGGGIDNVKLYIDGVLDTTNSTGVNGTYIINRALTTGFHNWSVLATNLNSSTNQSETRFFNITIYSPNITITSPINYYNTSNPLMEFDIKVTDDFGVSNVSLLVNGSVIGLYGIPTLDDLYPFYETFGEGFYYWSILAYDNDSNPTQSSNRYFTIDYTNPIINIVYPINATYLNTSVCKVNNFTTWFNWTASDTNLQTCIWYNGTGNNTITCNSNASISFLFGTYTFIAYANDSVGLTASSSVTATYGYYLFENAVNYTRYTTEGNQEQFNFTLNKTSLYTISSVDLYYNGTKHVVTDYSSSSNYQKVTKTINIPSVTANGDATFYFSVLFSDGTRINSTTYTQQVNNTFIAVCNATYTNKIFNFTLVDEATQTNLSNGSIEASINLYSTDKSILVHSYSTYINNTDNLQLCLSSPITSPNYLIDGVVKYNDLTHATEYYNFVNYSYVNATIGTIIMLYDLLLTDSTEFQIIFRDENFIALPDVLIYVNREYISENTFKTVELPKTDSQGQTIVHLVRNDINYNIYAVKNGIILASFNNLRAYCEDYTIGNCKLYLTASSTSPQTYNQSASLGISYSFSYSITTGIITFNFLSSDLITNKNVNMVVWRNTYFGNTSYCNTSLLSSSGSLTCNISGITGSDTTVRVEVLINGDLLINEYVDITDKGTDRDYYFIFFIFLIAFIFIFIDSKTTVILGIVLGFGSAFALGIIKGKMFGLGSAGIFLIIMAILMIWKLNKEKPQ